MSSTTFTSGTVIASTWLNDVNNAVYNGSFPTQVSSAGISYAPSGTGAVTTTVQAKLQQTISVFDYLSSSDIATVQSGSNTNDISSKVQAAINYASSLSGATVWFPTGCYYLGTASPAISIPSNVHLAGATSSYRGSGENGLGVEFLYGGTGTAIYAQGMDINCNDFSVRFTSPSGSSCIGILHDGGWFGSYKRLTFKNIPTANGYSFKMTSGPVGYGAYACCMEQIDTEGASLLFTGRNSGDGITTLSLKDVDAEKMSFAYAQGVILNGACTITSGTAFYFSNYSFFTMIGVDIEGTGDYGILINDSTCQIFEFGTLWGGWSGTTRVLNLGTVESRVYGQFSSQQKLTAGTANQVSKFGGQSASNGIIDNYVSDFVVPTNISGGTQDAYRQWKRYNSGANIVEHDWQQHAFVKKAISTSSTSAATIFTVPVPTGQGLKLSAHAEGAQVGDNYYSNSRGCNVINSGGTLTIVQDTQVTCGATCAISYVASGANLLVQWTPTTTNASSGTMNLEIRGPWTSYS